MSGVTFAQTPKAANLYLFPSSDYATGMTRVPIGGTNASAVDDPVGSPNEDTDYVYMNTISFRTDMYNMSGHTTESGTINYIMVVSRAKAYPFTQDPGSYYQHKIIAGTGSQTGNNLAPMQTTYGNYFTIFPVRPSDSGVWLWTDIDSLIAGMTANSSFVTQTLSDIIRPSGAGAINECYRYLNSVYQGLGDATNYTYVDEVTPDYTATYLTNEEAHVQKRDSYLHTVPTGWSGAINYVKLVATITDLYANGGSFKHAIRYSGTNYDGPQFTAPHSGVWTQVENSWTVRPWDSAAWTWANITDMEIGFIAGNTGTNWYDAVTQLFGVINHTEYLCPEIRTTQLYVIVNYIPMPITVTLLSPDEVQFSNTRKTERFIFPDGTYTINDYGRQGKSMSLTGTEMTNAIQNMRAMQTMVENNAPVTISGLMDVNQDTTWRFSSFNFDYDPSGDHFNWKAEFEAI